MATYFTAGIPRDDRQDRQNDGLDPALRAHFDAGRLGDADAFGSRLAGQRLLANESAANDALTQYRLAAIKALGDFGALRGKAAVDGHDAYRQTLQAARDQAFGSVDGLAQGLLRAHLDRAHNDHLFAGLAHHGRQDKEWASQSTLAALEADKKLAVLRRGDETLLQQVIDRSDEGWRRVGQHKGWPDDIVRAQADQAKLDLMRQVIEAKLQDGDRDGVQRAWQFAHSQLGPDLMQRMMQNRHVRGERQQYWDIDPTSNKPLHNGQTIQLNDRDARVKLDEPQLARANDKSTGNGATIEGPEQQLDGAQIKGDVAQNITPKLQYTAENYKKAREIIAGVKSGAIGNLNWNIMDILHDPKSIWDGSTTPEGGFDTFISPEEGSRAAYKNLLANIPLLKVDASLEKPWLQPELTKITINNLARRLLGPKDNAQRWIFNVSTASRIKPEEEIDVTNIDKVATLLHGIAIAERGVSPPMSTIVTGINMAINRTPMRGLSLEETRNRFREIARRAPGSGPTARNNAIPDIRGLIDMLWDEEFAKQDQKIRDVEDDVARIGTGPGHR